MPYHFLSYSITHKKIHQIQQVKTMLYYVAIHKSEGLDCSEGQDCVRNTALKSRQCTSCQFYFYIRNNYRYEKNVCDGCYQGINYEEKNYTMIFRILETKKEPIEQIAVIFCMK